MPSIRSSTAEQYASSSLDTAILHLLSSAGFVRSSSNATHVLTEVLQRYFRLLAAHSAAYAEHAGRTEIAPLDLLRTLEEVGTSVEEVKQWAVEGDGKEVAWAPKDSSGAEVLGQNGKDLRRECFRATCGPRASRMILLNHRLQDSRMSELHAIVVARAASMSTWHEGNNWKDLASVVRSLGQADSPAHSIELASAASLRTPNIVACPLRPSLMLPILFVFTSSA